MVRLLLYLGFCFNLYLLGVNSFNNNCDFDIVKTNVSRWSFVNIKELVNKFKSIKAHDSFFNKLVIDSNSKIAVTAGFDKTIKIWDLKSQSLLQIYDLKSDNIWITALKMTKDSKYLIAGCFNGSVIVFDLTLNSNRPIYRSNDNSDFNILDIKIDYSRNVFITCGSDGIAVVNSLNNIGSLRPPIKVIKSDEPGYQASGFTINKDFMFIAKSNSHIKIYSLDNYSLIKEISLTDVNSSIKKLYCINSYLIVVFDDLIKIYNIDNFQELSSFEIKWGVINDFPCTNVSVGFNDSQEFIVYVNKNNKVCRYNLKSGENKELFDAFDVTCLTIANNQLILIGDGDSNLTIYNNGLINKLSSTLDTSYLDENMVLNKKNISLGPIGLSKDGKYLILGSIEGQMRILNISDLYFKNNKWAILDIKQQSNATIQDFCDVNIITRR